MFFIQTWIVLAGALAAALGLLGVLVARRGEHSPTLAIAGTVLGLLAIGSVFTTEALVRNFLNDRFGALVSDTSSDPGTALPSEPALPSGTASPTSTLPLSGDASSDPAGGTPPPPAGDLAPNNSDAPLQVGASGAMVGWQVSVTSVTTDAAEAIEGGGNPPPTNGRYLLVELSATSTGEITDAENPSLLTVGLAGGDGLEYSSIGCKAVLDRPVSSVGSLSVGDTGSWQACIDASPGALEGSSLFISQLSASHEERVYFQVV
jgi:hypothetical protein